MSGFGKTSNGLNASTETPCPIDKLPMRNRDKTILARIPKGTHTEIRRVHATCVPIDSPQYQRACELVGE